MKPHHQSKCRDTAAQRTLGLRIQESSDGEPERFSFFFFLNDMFLGILIHLFDVLDVLDGG
jgi:hypothetical protein